MIQARALLMAAKNQIGDYHTSILLPDHLQKTNTKQNPPKIKTSIGHTCESGFGYVVGRQEGEKAHLDLFVCFNAPRTGDIPRHPLITTLIKKDKKNPNLYAHRTAAPFLKKETITAGLDFFFFGKIMHFLMELYRTRTNNKTPHLNYKD